ncbi:MAG: DNA gyrase subunit A [Gammaproteobacteria bacterium]|nr:DNA gyrase subunit A [Gammaproteobacteria bacterium]
MMQISRSRERILPRPIEEEMRESFLDYSMSVIVQRALPDVRDGLKPVHRRILFAMHELGLAPDRSYKKSATVVGDVLGKYHPHGDSAVYDALVRMVQDFSLRYPLVDGQGNFGSIDGDPAAAYRYTEARLSRVAADLLTDIARDTVDWTPNFDGRLQEPVVVPSRLPNLLMNGSAGIAVGMSTNVPPHNLGELVAAIRKLADDDEPTLDELMEVIPGPDFPTGGFIVGRKGIRQMYRTGRGRIVMRARVVREKIRGGREQLVITELPYATSKSKIIAQIAGLSRKGALPEVSNLRDESDRDGVRLVIELKRGADSGKVLKRLLRRTSLQSTFGAILLALDKGEPREFALKEMLERFRDHRLEVIQRRSRHELEKAEDRAHVIEGMLRALDFIDEVIAIIRSSDDRAQAAGRLQDELDLSERQAGAILDMQLARLTSLERQKLEDELVGLRKTIRQLRRILSSEYRQLQLMLEELEEGVREFGDARRTTILDRETASKASVKAAVADEDVVVTVSHQGFVKRMPVHLYRRRLASGKLLAGMERYPDDYLERLFVARTQGWILAFTEGGHVHFLSVTGVPESGLASRGQSLYSLTKGSRADPFTALLQVDSLTAEGQVVFVTGRGTVKRTRLSEFSNPRPAGLAASRVRLGDRIVAVMLSEGGADIMLATRHGRAIRFAEGQVPVMGRAAFGVKGIGLRGDDLVVSALLIRRAGTVLAVSDQGWGRRTDVNDYPLQKRGGLGVLMTPPGGGDGRLIGAIEVLDQDAVMLVTAAGRITQVAAGDVPVTGKGARGSRLAQVEVGDRVVRVTRTQGGASPGGGGGAAGSPAGTGTAANPAEGAVTNRIESADEGSTATSADRGDGVEATKRGVKGSTPQFDLLRGDRS